MEVVSPRLDDPLLCLVVIVRESPSRQHKGNGLSFSWRELELRECLQLLRWSDDARVARRDIELYDLFADAFSDILDGDLHLDRFARFDALRRFKI